MKTVYIYLAVAAAIAVLVGGIMLSSQGRSAASVEKLARHQQNGLDQNPTQNVPNTSKPDSNKGAG